MKLVKKINILGTQYSVYRVKANENEYMTKMNYGGIKTDEPRTLDFSGVRGFLVTNVCIVQRSAA